MGWGQVRLRFWFSWWACAVGLGSWLVVDGERWLVDLQAGRGLPRLAALRLARTCQCPGRTQPLFLGLPSLSPVTWSCLIGGPATVIVLGSLWGLVLGGENGTSSQVDFSGLCWRSLKSARPLAPLPPSLSVCFHQGKGIRRDCVVDEPSLYAPPPRPAALRGVVEGQGAV